MLDKDFNWCYNHENLFREWLRCIYNLHKSHPDERLESNTIFLLWQEAKECALQIANSEEPGLLYRIRMNDVITKRPNHWKGLMYFLNTMLTTSKNKNLEIFVNIINKTVRDYLNKKKIDENSIDEFAKDTVVQTLYLASGQVKSDYDYSLPDGGIKDETETDETKTDETITQTKTNETITETDENSVDVILQNYNSFNNEDFISAMQKAIEIGWIEKIEDSRYKWIGPTRIGTKKIKGHYNSALAYFIAKALKIKMELKADKTPTEDSYVDINKKFPENYDIKEVFGLDIQSDQLVNALRAKNIQKWRKAIDDFFDEET